MAAHRRDFYKISLIKGTGRLYYADRGIEVNANALLFSNPVVPYAWEATSSQQEGYFCVFKEDFVMNDRGVRGLAGSPLFQLGSDPVFFLQKDQQVYLSSIFEKMLEEIRSDYVHKYDLLKNYVHLVIHEAMKLQPNNQYFHHGGNASERITHFFIEALELQFPIDSNEHRLEKRSPADFAELLSVHVNHLNRAVKEITGKTTGELISQRIVQEAQALLKHTHWNIAEISYCLGFNEPSYFSNFFKKHTGVAPGSARN